MSSEEAPGVKQQVVLILVGLVASGKTTFAEALQEHFPQFRRCSQDELGNRRKVEDLARRCLREGYSVCIDRTNADAGQRAHWIDIAHELPDTAIWVIYFDTPYNICASRLQQRTYHPTIASVADGLRILARFSSTFQQPTPHEGHNRILRLTPSDHPSAAYTRDDILAILRRVRESPHVESTMGSGQPRITHFFRGDDNPRGYGRGRENRGRGRGVGGPSSNIGASRSRGSWHSHSPPWAAYGKPHGQNRGYSSYRGGRGSARGWSSQAVSDGRQHGAAVNEARARPPERQSMQGSGSSKDPLVLD